MLANPVHAQQRRDKPADGAQKGKRLVGLPGAAVCAAEPEAGPVKSVAAGAAEPVDEQTERDEPSDGEHEVCGPVDKAARKGEQPDDGEEDGEAGHYFGVDEAG